MTKVEHHVAWKDRLGFNQQWSLDVKACSELHGIDKYVNQVDRFVNDIVNIKNGPKLHDIITKYWVENIVVEGSKTFEKWIVDHPQEARIEEERNDVQERIRQNQAEKLYHFIIQTLEDNGFGFYESTIPIDTVGLDD